MKKRIIATAIAALFSQPRFSPLPYETDSLDKIPEDKRGLYVEKNGKYRIDVDEDLDGLKSSVAAARGDAKKEREAKAALEARIKEYEGLPEASALREMLKKLDGDDEAAMIRRGEIDKVVERRTQKLLEAHQKELKAKEDELGKYDSTLKKYRDRVLSDHIRAAAAKAGVHPTAVDDAILAASRVFSLDDEANAVQLEDGKPVLATGGKPYSPEHWMEEMKEKKPHWFPGGNTGGGASGSGAGGAKTIKRSAFDALGPREQAAKMKEGFKVVD